MKSFLIALMAIYVVFSLTFCSLQRKFLYFPQPARQSYGADSISFLVNGMKLKGWVLNADLPKALIYYGGNAENIEDNIPFFEQVLPQYSIYLIPYRGYGDNTGEPTEQALYSDAKEIFQQISKQHESVSLMGRSLGSGVATYVAANRKVDKLILVTPFDSIENVAKDHYWMFPVSMLIKDKYLSSERVKDITADTYIFIAEDDRVIPRTRSEKLVERFGEQLEAVFVIKGAGHNTISAYPAYVEGLKQALD